MSGLMSDLKFGFRLLRKHLETTSVAILAMAIAIGVAGTMFSVVNTILIQPLPFKDPDRLVSIWQIDPSNGSMWRPAAPGNYQDWRRMSGSFETIGAALNISRTLTSFDEPDTPLMQQVSAGYFETLGVSPILGRTFTAEEDRPASRSVVVLSNELWQRRFGGDRGVIGRMTELDGKPFEIIGVMPAGFDNPIFGLTERPQVWIPLALAQNGLDRLGNDHYVIARLSPGVTVEQAQQELSRISEDIRIQHPDTNRSIDALVKPLKENIVRGVRPAVLLLFGAVLFVLLIASSNAAHLLLTRSVAREREFAVRRALGADGFRLTRQLFVESLSLMLICAIPGLMLTFWGTEMVGSLIPTGLNIPQFDFRVDANVVLFTLAVSLAPAIGLGVLPALYARRISIAGGLAGSVRTTGNRNSRRMQKLLVIGETALSLMLLIAAALMAQSFRNLQKLDQGFDPTNVLTFRVSTRGAEYKESARRQRFFKDIQDRLAEIPGVLSVGAAQSHPFYPQFGLTTMSIEGRPQPEPGNEPRVTALKTSPGYFPAMKIKLLRGRTYTDNDTASTPPVVLISAQTARQFWPGEDPIGKRLAVNASRNVLREVVGIVADIRSDGFPPDPRPTVYAPIEQDGAPATIAYVLRTTGEPLSYLESAKKAVWSIDRGMPVYLVRTMEETVNGLDWRSKFMMSLLAIFSIISLFLAITGIYAALSYVVSQQTRELGVRMALGAQTSDVLRMVLRNGMTITGAGIGIGLVASIALTRVMSALLFGVSASDPLTFISISLLLAGVALGACFVPALRATRVDPMIALRCD